METDKEYKSFVEWLDAQPDYGLCSPPITEKQAFKFIKMYLLPKNWYSTMPQSRAQTDCEAMHDILMTYSSRYRKEYVNYRNRNRGGWWTAVRRILGFTK